MQQELNNDSQLRSMGVTPKGLQSTLLRDDTQEAPQPSRYANETGKETLQTADGRGLSSILVDDRN